MVEINLADLEKRVETLEQQVSSLRKRGLYDYNVTHQVITDITYLTLCEGAIVGDQDGITVSSKWLRSSNYVAAATGWSIAGDGSAEFNDVTVRGTIYASAGLIGGWTINTASLSAGSVTLDPVTPAIRLGGATGYLSGTGIWMGLDGGVYKTHIGDPAGDHLRWTGTELYITGTYTGGTATLDSVLLPEMAVPAAPAANYIKLFAVADADFTVLETITDLSIVNRLMQDTFRVVRNTTGVTVAAAKAVYFSGSTGNKPNFALARANAEATMPAVGMTTAAVANNAFGQVMIVGRLTGVKTDYATWAEGQQLYVDPTTPGELTNVRPTHPNLAQWVGTIEVVHAVNGVILVHMQALTGIEDGTNRNSYTIGDTLAGTKSLIFNGTADGTLQWDSTNSLWSFTTGKVGICTISPSEALEIANAAGGRFNVSDGGGASRKAVLIQSPGATYGYGRILAHDYGAGTGLDLVLQDSGGKVRIGAGVPVAKLDAVSTTEQLRLLYDAANYVSFTVGSGGNLTIAPTGDFIFDPVGNDILPATNYDLNIGMISKKYLTLHCAELWVETLVAQDTLATIGGRILVGPTTILTSDLAVAATTMYVKHNNLANGDRVYLEANAKVEFIAVASAPGGSGPYSYTITRNLDGSGANDWYAGDAVFNTGTTGDGFIDIYSLRGVKEASDVGPTIVGNVRNSATYNDWTECWALGNLNGLYGYGVDTYGVGLGKYSAANYITIDPTNGVRFFDSADAVLAQLTSTTWTLGNTGTEHISISSTAVQIKNGATVYVDLTSAALTIGDTANEHVHVDTSGLTVQDGATTLATFGSTVTVGPVGAGLGNVTISAGALGIRLNTTERIGLTSAGVLTIKDSGGAAVFTFDASAGAEITKKLTMPGANSAIAIGSTPPTSATVGTGIWIDRTGLFGLASSVQQAYISATDGKLYAGGGNIYLDSSGCRLVFDNSYSSQRSIEWLSGGSTVRLSIRGYNSSSWATLASWALDASGNPSAGISMQAYTAWQGRVDLAAYYNATDYVALALVGNTGMTLSAGGSGAADLRAQGGGYFGATDTDPAAGTITATDYIVALGGLHVGGTSDPGTDNLLVDGTAQITGNVGFYGTAPAARPSVLHGNTDGEIGALTISAMYVQAEMVALRDKCEELADDVRSLRAGLVTLGLVAEA